LYLVRDNLLEQQQQNDSSDLNKDLPDFGGEAFMCKDLEGWSIVCETEFVKCVKSGDDNVAVCSTPKLWEATEHRIVFKWDSSISNERYENENENTKHNIKMWEVQWRIAKERDSTSFSASGEGNVSRPGICKAQIHSSSFLTYVHAFRLLPFFVRQRNAQITKAGLYLAEL
jgi:hypothetical protein